jgi:hypothetical protein
MSKIVLSVPLMPMDASRMFKKLLSNSLLVNAAPLGMLSAETVLVLIPRVVILGL